MYKFNAEKQVKDFLKQINSLCRKKPFQVGDKVTAFGNIGTIKSISQNGYIEVSFPEAPSTVIFNIDGKISKWNNAPSLRKV